MTAHTATEAQPTGQATGKGFNWRHQAACRIQDPEMFFPVGTGDIYKRRVEIAKNVCRSCPVVEECFAWAISTGQIYGVSGGLSEEERRKHMRIPTCGQCEKSLEGMAKKRRFCSRECSTAYHKHQARERLRQQYPLSRIV